MASGALLAAAALAIAAAGSDSASAARGGGTTVTASIRLDQADPHLGDSVTFTTTGGSRIAVACYQGGVGSMVWSTDQPTGTAFLLGGASSEWTAAGGAADCWAWLYPRNTSKGAVAATRFAAAGWR